MNVGDIVATRDPGMAWRRVLEVDGDRVRIQVSSYGDPVYGWFKMNKLALVKKTEESDE